MISAAEAYQSGSVRDLRGVYEGLLVSSAQLLTDHCEHCDLSFVIPHVVRDGFFLQNPRASLSHDESKILSSPEIEVESVFCV
jgi:hypothetical protein